LRLAETGQSWFKSVENQPELGIANNDLETKS